MKRLLALGQALIDSRRGIALEQYAKANAHSRSAVFRDIGVLREVGFPVTSERGRHRLPAHFKLFGHRGLEPDELLSLFVARQIGGRLPGTRYERALASLWAKATDLEAQPSLGPSAPSALTVAAFQTIDYTPHRATIEFLEQAVEQRTAVHIRYRKPSTSEVSTRVVEPGELYADAAIEGLYLIAYCRLRRAVRIFAVQRILSVTSTGERCPVRPETRSKIALRDAFRGWLGRDGAAHTVRLRFSPALATEIAERRWHTSQVTTRGPAGDLIVELRVAEPNALIRWLMSFGPDVAIEVPTWLAAEVRELHHRAAALAVAPLPASKPARSA